MNYNTLSSLWVSYLTANPDERLLVKNGCVWSAADGAIGQFSTTKDAINTLRNAGYPDDMIENRDI